MTVAHVKGSVYTIRGEEKGAEARLRTLASQ